MAEDKRSARELLQHLRGRGLSNAEIAREIQRSPRMVRKVLNGETSGAAYTKTLRELATTGRATTVPPRRRTKDGQLVRVRTKAGATEKSTTPADTGGRYSSQKQGGRFASTTYLSGGGRQHEINIPKGKTAKGRQEATADLLSKVRSAARGQSKETQKRVRLHLTFANGRMMEVNDYNASTLLKRMNEQGGRDPLGWLAAQSAERYPNLDTGKTAITGVTMTVYNAPRTERSSREYRPRASA